MKIHLIAVLIAISLGIAACKSKEDQQIEQAYKLILTKIGDTSQVTFISGKVEWTGNDESSSINTKGLPGFVVRVEFEQPNGTGGFEKSCYFVPYVEDAQHHRSLLKTNAFGALNPCDKRWLTSHDLTETQAIQNEISTFK